MVARYTERVQIMLRPEQHERLKAMAAANDQEVSPFLRSVIEDALLGSTPDEATEGLW